MSNVSTKIIEALLKNESVNEVFRQELESALNQLFTIELDSFLNYGRYDPAGYNSGDSRNGYYRRILHTEYGDLNRMMEPLFHFRPPCRCSVVLQCFHWYYSIFSNAFAIPDRYAAESKKRL